MYDSCCNSVEIVIMVMTNNNVIDPSKNEWKLNFILYSVCSLLSFVLHIYQWSQT